MAEDDLISAMWRSLVPTFEYSEGAGDVDSSAVDHRNRGEVVGVKPYYAEADQNFLVQTYPDIEPLDYWNPQETMMEDYTKAVCSVEFLTEDEASVEMQQALSDSLKPKDIYCLEDLEMDGFWNELTSSLHDTPNIEVEMIKAPVDFINVLRSSGQPKKKLYRLPRAIREANEDYYCPQYISIGPYHNRSSTTSAAEWDKYKFYENLRLNERIFWSKCEPVIQAWEREVRDYYVDLVQDSKENDPGDEMVAPEKEDTVEMTSYKLARCMFLDACFILAHFRILQWSNVTSEPNSIPERIRPFTRDNNWNIPLEPVTHDIFLVENQMPFFIIQIMYDECTGKDTKQKSSLRSQIVEYLRKTVLKPYPIAISIEDKETNVFQHILHYCHLCFTPSSLRSIDRNAHPINIEEPGDSKELSRWRRATDLYEKGIRFRPKDRAPALLDIEFDNVHGALTIPTLIIDRYTTFLFANILAFEQSSMPANSSNQLCNNYFSAYVKFMADLMTTPEDITLLARKRIIENNLGKNDEVLDLFNTLKKGIGFLNSKDTYLSKTFTDLEEHYDNRATQYWTDLRRNYCKNPWLILGVVVTTAGFIFSGMAAIFNLRDHVRSCNSCN